MPDQHLSQNPLAKPGFGHRQLEQDPIITVRFGKCLVQRLLGPAGLLVDELAAHPVAGRQLRDRFAPSQRLN